MRSDTVSSDIATRSLTRFWFRNGTLDFYVGWLLGYGQVGGLSPGALYCALNQIRRHDPRSWVAAFTELLDKQSELAARAGCDGQADIAAQHELAAVCAARAALTLIEPGSPDAARLIERMEGAFQTAMRVRGVPMLDWQIPFGDTTLPAYVTTGLGHGSPLVVVVGGGDTYREDLWFLGGKATQAAGYQVLLVDLPGQGRTPDRGLHFGPQTIAALDAAIRATRARGHDGQTVLMGWSGGGLFTAKYIETYGGVDAWVASTPIRDMARVFEQAMPALLRRRPGGWWQHLVMRGALAFDPVRAATLAKYEYQFGPGGIAAAVDQLRDLGPVDLTRLDAPLLALVADSEAAELRRQADEVVRAVVRRHPNSRLVTFPPATGADAHCQVTNLPLATAHILDWLAGPAAVRPRREH